MDSRTSHETPRLLPRQQLLIGLLNSFDYPLPNLHFQKLLFLYCQESAGPVPYEFVPYQLGPFSFTSYADRRKLTLNGLLEDEDSAWHLTPSGRRSALGIHHAAIDSFVDRYRMHNVDELVAEAYRKFPYYAIRSEIAGRVLGGDTEALRLIDAARPQSTASTLFTIGYESSSLDRYLNTLLQAGVTLLCDVRRNAISRKYGFAKSTLSNACARLGIRYEHLPELGISSEKRKALVGRSDYSRLLWEYENHHLPNQQDALTTTVQWVRSGECVALTCFERDAENCHRSRVATEIARRMSMPSPVRHL